MTSIELDDRIVVVLSPAYCISYTNAACYGLSIQDIVGRHIAEFVGLQHFSQALKTNAGPLLQGRTKGEQRKHTFARQVVHERDDCHNCNFRLINAGPKGGAAGQTNQKAAIDSCQGSLSLIKDILAPSS